MRYLYLALCIVGGLLPHRAAAQVVADSVQTDSATTITVDERWVRSQVDSAGECTEAVHWAGRGGLVRAFHPSGRLKDYIPYADFAAGQVHGVVTSWYDNGQLAARQTFLHGQREGTLALYYADGQLKRQTQYTAGSEAIGSCFGPDGTPLAYFPYEQPPLYPGGQLQLQKELSRTVQRWRPTGPLVLNKAQLHVSFQIKENGQVANPRVTVTDEQFTLLQYSTSETKSLLQHAMSEGLAPLVSSVQQAMTRLTKSFYPGKRDGAAVSWNYTLTIPFNYELWEPRQGNIPRRGTNFGR